MCSLVALTATPLHGSATGILCLVSVHIVLGLHATLFTFCVSVLQCSDLLVFLVCLTIEILYMCKCSVCVSRIMHICCLPKAKPVYEIVYYNSSSRTNRNC